MQSLYLVAAGLCFALGVAHSILGERYILIRLFRRADLPKLFGGTEFTSRTLRFAWHLTSVAWWGAAALFYYMARDRLSSASVAAGVGGRILSECCGHLGRISRAPFCVASLSCHWSHRTLWVTGLTRRSSGPAFGGSLNLFR